MKIGIAAHLYSHGRPIVDLARAAEALGFESLWIGEHIIIPVDIAKPALHGVPLPENYKYMPDLFVWLTAAATVTNRLKLGMDVCLVAQRNPLHLAKEIASLDLISGGRVIFGIGSGWIEEEAEIMGYPFQARWPKTMEHLRALKTLWMEEKPSFSGEYVSFPPVYCYPKPLQKPHPPILIGAGNHTTNNSPILRRVAEIADGWLPVFLSPAQMKTQLGELKELCDANGRDYSKMDITLLVPAINLGVGERPPFFTGEASPGNPHELIAEYEEAGVTRIIVGVVPLTVDAGLKVLEDVATGLRLH